MTKIKDGFNTLKFEDLEEGSIFKIGRDYYLKPGKEAKYIFPGGANCICLEDGELGHLNNMDMVIRIKEMDVVSYG